jgi:hypothetical protein
MRASLIAAMACLALLQVGCGGSSTPSPRQANRQAARDVVDGYNAAVLAGDGQRACSYMTAAAQRELAANDRSRPASGSCAHALAAIHRVPNFVRHNKNITVNQVVVHPQKGTGWACASSSGAAYGCNATYRLVKTGGPWKINMIFSSSIGP